MKKLVTCLLSLLLVSCGYDEFGDLSPEGLDGRLDLPNAELSIFRERPEYGKRGVIVSDVVFCGRVVANDKSGNFYRSFIVQDGFGAVEIRAGYGFLHSDYPVGQRVMIYAKGLAYERYDGVVRLGRSTDAYDPYRIADFGSRLILERHVVRDTDVDKMVPRIMEIPALSDWYCGSLIRINGLTFVGETPERWGVPREGNPSSNVIHRFVNEHGEHVRVVTSTYADFATETIPFGRKLSLTGILLYGKYDGQKECFALKLRGIEDVE